LCRLCEGLLVLVSEGLKAVAGCLALCSEAVLGVLVADGELGVCTCGSWVLLIDSLEVTGDSAWWLIVDQADWVLDQMALAKLVVW